MLSSAIVLPDRGGVRAGKPGWGQAAAGGAPISLHVSFEGWCVLMGALLVVVAVVASFLARLPVTAAMVYLAAGIVIGPIGLGWVRLDPVAQSAMLERLSEVAVIVSLFTTGLKLRVPLNERQWWGPVRLAFVSMAITVGLITLAGTWLLGLPLGAAVILGAVLAPTDPVLASGVQVREAGDREPVRFALTGEAGLNDGTAFPFVMLGLGLLGLHELGPGGALWLGVDVLWAIGGGLGIGAALGSGVGWVVLWMRRRHQEGAGRDEFLALGLIGLAYGVALFAHTYGFLAVFAAGLALREVERRAEARVESHPNPAQGHEEEKGRETVGAVTAFNEQAERIVEVALVLAVGLMLSLEAFRWSTVGFAALLFLGIRPVAVALGLLGTGFRAHQRRLIGWLGIRGIGSVYYLMYALQHGVPEAIGRPLAEITLLVIAGSILVHGITETPLMRRSRA